MARPNSNRLPFIHFSVCVQNKVKGKLVRVCKESRSCEGEHFIAQSKYILVFQILQSGFKGTDIKLFFCLLTKITK